MRTDPIARRRFFKPNENFVRGPRVNEGIRARQVRLIDENNEMVGVVSTSDALDRAREAELDLVEVARDSDPPVCRILDFGKWKYEQSKKEKATKAKSRTAEQKEVRLGRSMKIDPHDVEIRMNQARKFLMEGHKVLIVQNFRGREMAFRHRGIERMNAIAQQLSDIAKLETPPRQMGRRMSMVLAPDRTKIEAIRRRAAHSQPQQTEQDSPSQGPDASEGARSEDEAAESVQSSSASTKD